MFRNSTIVRRDLRAAVALPITMLFWLGCADDGVAPSHPLLASLTSKEQCMDGGWRDFGFRNQGQCIRFVESGKDSRSIVDAFGSESFAPGRTGQVRTLSVGDFTFTYEVIDGLAIFEGDMVLGSAGEVAQWGRARDVEVDDDPDVAASNLIFSDICWFLGADPICLRYRWPNGVVPYEVDLDTWDPDVRPDVDETIRAAIRHWEENTGLVFIRRSGQSDYVVFQDGDGCASFVGRVGGEQAIWLAARCSFGSAVHEIGHALGIAHEHSRDDRDSFIEILWDNIQSDRQFAFATSNKTFDSGDYDFGSIMHYPPRAFGIRDQLNPETGMFDRPRITIQAREGDPSFGQRDALSLGDIRAAYVMYGTPPDLTILSPFAGTPFSYRSNVSFLAVASDWGGRTPDVAWFLDEELLGTGLSITTMLPLPIGVDEITHTVTARAVDLGGRTTTRTIDVVVRNLPPSVSIQSPTPSSLIFRDVPFTLRGMVIDPDGGPLDCEWTSSVAGDPFPVAGCDATVTFPSGGARTLTLTATDERGLSAAASVAVTVQEEAPDIIVTIDSPDDGMFIFLGQEVLLEASASGGEPPHDIAWSVNWPYDPQTGQEGPNTAHIADEASLFWKLEDTIPESDLGCEASFHLKLTADATDASGATGSQFVVLRFVHIC